MAEKLTTPEKRILFFLGGGVLLITAAATIAFGWAAGLTVIGCASIFIGLCIAVKAAKDNEKNVR